MTTTTDTPQVPYHVLNVLSPMHQVGTRPVIPSRELRVGDTMFASGWKRGGDRRRVLEIRYVKQGGVDRMYVRVKEGWYHWTRVYVNVAEY